MPDREKTNNTSYLKQLKKDVFKPSSGFQNLKF